MSQNSQTHFVKSGDTLQSIAKSYQFSDWKIIYTHPLNENFRKLRPNPNLIFPGDKIVIPSNPLMIANQLRQQVQRLEIIKQDSITLFNEMEKGLQNEFNKVESFSKRIDFAADIATFFAGKALKFPKKGPNPEAIDEWLDLLIRDYIKDSLKKDIINYIIKIIDNESLPVSLIKIGWESWNQMTSPTYWASRITGQTPLQAFENAKRVLEQTRKQNIDLLDQKIAKTQELIKACSPSTIVKKDESISMTPNSKVLP